MKIQTSLITALTGFFVLTAFQAGAQTITYNFDDDVNPFDAGTISTLQAQSGPKSLQFTGDEFATWNLPSAYLNKSIQVTMSVFDEGRWRTDGGSGNPGNGPRWGVGHDTTGGDYAAVSIVHKSFLQSDSAYGRNGADAFLGQFSRNEWFGPGYMGSRASAHLSPTPDDGSTGTGTWTTWTFDVDHITGDVNFSGAGSAVRNTNIGQSATALYLFGGDANGGGTLAGMYVDDITVTVTAVPEPGTLALMAIAAGCLGMMVVHRHRKS